MSLEPKKTGGPISKFWESSEIITSMEIVKGWLGKNAKRHIASDPPTAKTLSQLVYQLIEFQETNLGKGAKNPPFARLPMRYFYNFLPDGPLCRILATMYKFRNEQGWRRFDLSSPSRRETNLDMCREIQEALIEHDIHVVPKLYLSKNLDKEDRDKVKEIAKQRQLAVTDDEAEANASDPVLNIIEWERRRATLIAKRTERDGEIVYRFDVKMQGEDETVFFDI